MKLKSWQYNLLARIWSTRNSPSLLVGLQNSTYTLEDSFTVSYKTIHILTICCHSYTTRYLKN